MCLQYDVIASVVNANETANDNVDKDSARYAGLLLAPAECFGLGPRLFLPFGEKKAYYAVLAHCWCPVVTLVNQGSLDHVKVGPTPVLELHNL